MGQVLVPLMKMFKGSSFLGFRRFIGFITIWFTGFTVCSFCVFRGFVSTRFRAVDPRFFVWALECGVRGQGCAGGVLQDPGVGLPESC